MLTYFQHFTKSVTEFELPEKFTFPFYYEPHPLCKIAAEEVQNYLITQTDFKHNFGLIENQEGEIAGKMFGVLIVQNQQEKLGYITAVSGTLAEKNVHKKFVPPVYDLLVKDSHYLQEKEALKQLSTAIGDLENNTALSDLYAVHKVERKKAAIDIKEKKLEAKVAKKERDFKRVQAETELSPNEYLAFNAVLSEESLASKHFLNNVKRFWKHTLKAITDKIDAYTNEIGALKLARKSKSLKLQNYISDQYHFLNTEGITKKLADLFEETAIENIPSGSGECAAPKLLQYAFLNDLKPIAMAEFWWGQSPNKEIRKHGQFYAACQGRCKPILTHMLNGIDLDTNPLLQNPAIGKELETVFEDDELLVIYKPADFLSVPGVHIQDSVHTRIKQQVKNISGPITVHRLDMATSGLLVIAKHKRAHKFLQRQFIKRTINKRYTALLEGNLKADKGTIDLPLRGDLNDRPRQLVCFENGKPSITNWEVIERKNGRTKVHFYPVSGRTHQLRVHASHAAGLNVPIVGDDLYGKKAERLFLHADTLEFIHPTTKEKMTFTKMAEF